jgi:hypothetical protein
MTLAAMLVGKSPAVAPALIFTERVLSQLVDINHDTSLVVAREQVGPILLGAGGRRARSPRARWAILGAVGGLVAGGWLGAKIEGDRCGCDDPGAKGFLIGAPLGAIAGGVTAWKLAGR